MTAHTNATEALFSYGTLRYTQVQLDTFGRELAGAEDALTGFIVDQVEITDPEVLASSAQTFHPIIRYSGNPDDKVEGALLWLTTKELAQADSYEVDDYRRVLVTLASGTPAWVYVDANTPSLPA